MPKPIFTVGIPGSISYSDGTKLTESLQKEMNDIHTTAMYHRRLSLIKLIAKKGSIDVEEVEKFLNQDILSAIWVNDDINESVKVEQGGYVPTDHYQGAQILEGLVRDVMGMSRNQGGEFKQGSRSPTATEVNEVAQAANIRTDERRDMVADLLVKLIRDVNPIIFRNWNEETVTRVIGPGSLPLWISFRPSMLARGQYKFSVDPDETLPMTKNLREQKALALYPLLKTNPLIDPMELTRYLLHEMHGPAFDSMMRGIPSGLGLQQQKPLSLGQFSQLTNNIQSQQPQLLKQQPAQKGGG